MELIIIATAITIISVIVCYTYCTKFKHTITVDNKFSRAVGDKNSTSEIFCVSTTTGEIYSVKNSLLYWKFYSTETWNSLKNGHTYNITGYGLRCGFLSLYPNIISAQEV